MTRYEREQTVGLSVSVEQVARLIHSFDRRQKARLLQLVPELRTCRAGSVAGSFRPQVRHVAGTQAPAR